MSGANCQGPVLIRLYQRYLLEEDSAQFISQVARRYTLATLVRLAEYGDRLSRRAAILALGFLSGFEANAVLGRALHDEDRGVRILAETGIRQLWCRDGNTAQRQQLARIIRLNQATQCDEAVTLASLLIDQSPCFAEVWNQRAIAYYHLGRFEDSANDCQQTLELNPYHFGAAVGMAHCYLEMSDAFAALECFRRALRLNPDMESVRAQVRYLRRTLEGK